MKLTDNAKHLHKAYSVICLFLLAIANFAEGVLPLLTSLQPVLDPATMGIVSFTVAVLALIGRYIKQDNVEKQ